MRKCDQMANVARSLIGCPYVYGTAGKTCTPSLRRERASAHPDYEDGIKKYCNVLSGKKSTCSGCKYDKMPAFDCRGLTYYAAKKAGMSISSVGATTQWNSDSWIEKGLIADMPDDVPCMLFRRGSDGKTMQHTGINLGDGTVVDCRGHASGTMHTKLSSYAWTHYAIPKGAFDEYDGADPVPAPDQITEPKRSTIKKGSKGQEVKDLQNALIFCGYPLPKFGADGDCGSETVAAIRSFQADHSLEADGICGANTWAAIDAAVQLASNAEHDDVDEYGEPAPTYTVTIFDVDAATATYLLETYPNAQAVETGA